MADWGEMLAALEGALRTYREDKHGGAAEALAAVLDYLGGKEPGANTPRVEARLRTPLYDLLGRLADENKRQPADKALKAALDGATAAAAVSLLRQAGSNIDQAASRVARATGGAFTAAQIKELRRNIRRGRSRQEAQDHYWRVGGIAKQYHESLSAREIAERALSLVKDRFAAGPKG